MQRLSSALPIARFATISNIGKWRYFVLALMLVLLLVPVHPVSAGAKFVQANGASSTSNTTTLNVSLPAQPTAGNLLVLVCSTVGNANTTFTAPSGYTLVRSGSGARPSQASYWKTSVGGAADQTATCSFTRQKNTSAILLEYSGIMTTAPVVNASNIGNSTTATNPIPSSAVTTTFGRTLLVAALSVAAGNGMSTWTNGFTERYDMTLGADTAVADWSSSAIGTYSTAATNTAASAYRGQIIAFRIDPGQLSVGAVDGAGTPIVSPSITYNPTAYNFDCQTATGLLGTSAQKFRVTNTTASPGWALSIAPSGTLRWESGTNYYDVNDPGASGCTDGGDGDSYAGQMTVNPSVGSITAIGTGCTLTGITKGVSTSFIEGSVSSVNLLIASPATNVDCAWDLTGVAMSQTIPGGQADGDYATSMMMTLTSQ